MSKTTNWAVDTPNRLPKEYRKYYKTFNDIYYKHRKPSEEDCKTLNLSMNELIKLRSDGYRIENRQRQDCANFSDYADISSFERVTNRKCKLPPTPYE